MRKKTLLGTLIIVSVLIISCIPTILAESQTPDQPEEDCWVVTNDIVDPKIDEHNFFDEYTYPSVEAIENEQVWYKEYREPYPISNDNEWIYTTVECEAVTSGSNAILYVTTEGIVKSLLKRYVPQKFVVYEPQGLIS